MDFKTLTSAQKIQEVSDVNGSGNNEGSHIIYASLEVSGDESGDESEDDYCLPQMIPVVEIMRLVCHRWRLMSREHIVYWKTRSYFLNQIPLDGRFLDVPQSLGGGYML